MFDFYFNFIDIEITFYLITTQLLILYLFQGLRKI